MKRKLVLISSVLVMALVLGACAPAAAAPRRHGA